MTLKNRVWEDVCLMPMAEKHKEASCMSPYAQGPIGGGGGLKESVVLYLGKAKMTAWGRA